MLFRKVLHKREEIKQEKMKNLAERYKFGTRTSTMQCSFLHKNDFQIMIFLTDMAFLMSNFDDFDNGQIS